MGHVPLFKFTGHFQHRPWEMVRHSQKWWDKLELRMLLHQHRGSGYDPRGAVKHDHCFTSEAEPFTLGRVHGLENTWSKLLDIEDLMSIKILWKEGFYGQFCCIFQLWSWLFDVCSMRRNIYSSTESVFHSVHFETGQVSHMDTSEPFEAITAMQVSFKKGP